MDQPKAKKPATTAHSAVTTYRHLDTRTNIPTEELRGFVADDADTDARDTLVYPRDTSLDPQLVWNGKDEQDRADLQVSVVPIYIQEKIQPQAIIEQIRAQADEDSATSSQPTLFNDFNGLTFERMVDFYHNQQHWTNRMILGDSLLVMASLAEKEGLKGKVQMIYMDPPYGIKFGSNWQVSTRRREVKDGKRDDVTREPEQIKAFRDTWELGVHSYLTYLRDRLTVARDLLTESGSIFVQIGDENVHLVRCVLDEVFGRENAVLTIVLKKKGASTPTDPVNDFILWYAKHRPTVKVRALYEQRALPEDDTKFNTIITQTGEHIRESQVGASEWRKQATLGGVAARVNYPLVSQDVDKERSLDFVWRGKRFKCGENRHWTFDPVVDMHRLAKAERIFDGGGKSVGGIQLWSDWSYVATSNLWDDLHGEQDAIYVVQTNRKAPTRCMLMTTDPGDLVIDPTCGSGTTAYVAEQWGRRWITSDTSRVALALTRTRLMSARYPYYLLADSPEGLKKESEITGQFAPSYATTNDIRQGFVYKRVPHVTLKSIASNAEIDTIYERYQTQLERFRAQLNRALNQSWEEWEIPRDTDSRWPEPARQAHAEWWKLRRERQLATDASIARNADTELLYDQPYEDPKRVRVAGPFTVESLSPHRVLSPTIQRPQSEAEAQRDDPEAQFETLIVDSLRRAGVQNTFQSERLTFATLDLSPAGHYIQARGDYTDKLGQSKRVAVSIGPRYGAVGSEQVQLAAIEATKGIGCDVLLVCAFAFDAMADEKARELSPLSEEFAVTERTQQYGRIQVLLVRMNPDLNMGDKLLRNTGAGNLFMVFGQPDIQINRTPHGQLVIHLLGVDVYDPTTGEIRTRSTDNVACWFIDTNYNDQSFYVHHAYFTGAKDTYKKLKRDLRTEIDLGAWDALYTAESLPFDPPATGKIAIKVINDYGDEVLQVYPIQ